MNVLNLKKMKISIQQIYDFTEYNYHAPMTDFDWINFTSCDVHKPHHLHF